MDSSSHWVAGCQRCEECHSRCIIVTQGVCINLNWSVIETNRQEILGQRCLQRDIWLPLTLDKQRTIYVFLWLVSQPSLGFPLWIAQWGVMKSLKRKAPVMRSCSRVLLNAMCDAYCRAHTDLLCVINVLRACVADPILPNERKMALSSIQHARQVFS